MSYRRPHIDRVNPRYVPPSRHTLFIRGLPGSTNVDSVKNHFSSETDSKCSVEFFSTSDDKIRFSVAIRFKSQEIARQMLEKYNGKELLGHPVEICWFKDLKKARARIYDDQRSGRFRGYRGGYRGTQRGLPDRRGRGFSPGHGRDRSFSGGDGPGVRLHNSRRSMSSRSSRSDSGSHDSLRKRRRVDQSPPQVDNVQGSAKMPKRQARRSHSMSSSRSHVSSRSSSTHSRPGRNRSAGLQQKSFNRRAPGGAPGSPANDRQSFSNAPPPTAELGDISSGNSITGGGSSLLTGLIQLKTRRPLNSQSRLGASSSSSSHSKSASSKGGSSRSPSPKNRRKNQRRQKQSSPASSGLLRTSLKCSPSPSREASKAANLVGNNWKPVNFSEEVDLPKSTAAAFSADTSKIHPSNSSLFAAYGFLKAPPVGSGKIILSPMIDRNKEKRSVVDLDIAASTPSVEPFNNGKARSWEDFVDQHEKVVSGKSPLDTPVPPVKDKQTLIQERKLSIEEDYKKDCETFATVVRTLIGKDSDLEGRLLPLLKKILHERGQRCIEELRALIEETGDGMDGELSRMKEMARE